MSKRKTFQTWCLSTDGFAVRCQHIKTLIFQQIKIARIDPRSPLKKHYEISPIYIVTIFSIIITCSCKILPNLITTLSAIFGELICRHRTAAVVSKTGKYLDTALPSAVLPVAATTSRLSSKSKALPPVGSPPSPPSLSCLLKSPCSSEGAASEEAGLSSPMRDETEDWRMQALSLGKQYQIFFSQNAK